MREEDHYAIFEVFPPEGQDGELTPQQLLSLLHMGLTMFNRKGPHGGLIFGADTKRDYEIFCNTAFGLNCLFIDGEYVPQEDVPQEDVV